MIIADFEKGNDSTATYGLWQYDYGQILRVQGLQLPPVVEIHFSAQSKGGEAVTRIGITKDGVTDVVIPDSMLEKETSQDYCVYAFIYLTDETSGQTEYKIRMSVNARPKPEGWAGSSETTMEAILKAVNEIAARKADGLEYKSSILRLLSGETELAKVTINGGSGGGADAREIELRNDGTYIQWRYVGVLSWTNLISLKDITGPAGQDGATGLPGVDGKDGAPGKDGKGITSVTIKADGHLQINYSDNTNEDAGKVVGENGLDGVSGIPTRQEMTAANISAQLQPNILYVWPEMPSLTLTFAAPADTMIVNEYHCIFTSGETATTLSIPETIKVPDGFTVESNKIYELSVMENCLIWQSWEATA